MRNWTTLRCQIISSGRVDPQIDLRRPKIQHYVGTTKELYGMKYSEKQSDNLCIMDENECDMTFDVKPSGKHEKRLAGHENRMAALASCRGRKQPVPSTPEDLHSEADYCRYVPFIQYRRARFPL